MKKFKIIITSVFSAIGIIGALVAVSVEPSTSSHKHIVQTPAHHKIIYHVTHKKSLEEPRAASNGKSPSYFRHHSIPKKVI